MTDQTQPGMELAIRLLPNGMLLMAGLDWQPNGEEVVALMCCRVEREGIVPPEQPFAFRSRDIAAVRALALQAVEVLPHAIFNQDGDAVLGRNGDVASIASRRSSGAVAGLGYPDGTCCVVPEAHLGLLAEALAEAERKLAKLGLVSLSPDLTN